MLNKSREQYLRENYGVVSLRTALPDVEITVLVGSGLCEAKKQSCFRKVAQQADLMITVKRS